MLFDQGGDRTQFTEVAHIWRRIYTAAEYSRRDDRRAEMAGGFSNVARARTRIRQGIQLQILAWPRAEHSFQCCIILDAPESE